jgi:hypothetical protein
MPKFRCTLIAFAVLLSGMFLSSCDEDRITSPPPVVIATPTPVPTPTPLPTAPPPSGLVPCPPLDTVQIWVGKPNLVIADATPITTSPDYCRAVYPF